MKRAFFITIFLLIAAISFAQSDVYKYMMVDDHQRFYSVHLPPASDTIKNLPVIFAFHHGGSDYQTTVDLFKFNPIAEHDGVIMVYPNAMNTSWNIPGLSQPLDQTNGIDDIHFINVLLDTLIADYHVDTRRVFATGLSQGGMFTLYLANKLPNRFKAIAPVAASISQTMIPDFNFKHPIPVLLINGTADPLLKYDGGLTHEFSQGDPNDDDCTMMGTEDLVNKLVQMDSCDVDPYVHDMPNKDLKDECTAVETVYSNTRSTVDFIGVIGGGHTWPGGRQFLPKTLVGKICGDFNAEERIVKFFMDTPY